MARHRDAELMPQGLHTGEDAPQRLCSSFSLRQAPIEAVLELEKALAHRV